MNILLRELTLNVGFSQLCVNMTQDNFPVLRPVVNSWAGCLTPSYRILKTRIFCLLIKVKINSGLSLAALRGQP
jgi:hypothetical protein